MTVEPTAGAEHPFLSVIVPAYNEQARISASLVKLARYLHEQSYSWEVILSLSSMTEAAMPRPQSSANGQRGIEASVWRDYRTGERGAPYVGSNCHGMLMPTWRCRSSTLALPQSPFRGLPHRPRMALATERVYHARSVEAALRERHVRHAGRYRRAALHVRCRPGDAARAPWRIHRHDREGLRRRDRFAGDGRRAARRRVTISLLPQPALQRAGSHARHARVPRYPMRLQVLQG